MVHIAVIPARDASGETLVAAPKLNGLSIVTAPSRAQCGAAL
jgi:hypothetical protein